jgi:D-serine dehydratase
LWLNPRWQSAQDALPRLSLDFASIRDAEARLSRLAGVLRHCFPELSSSGGLIESPLLAVPRLQSASAACAGKWFIKADHALPVAGSIKARGGIYEVLQHAELLALAEGLVRAGDDDRIAMCSVAARKLFATHTIAVGSTGNLGLSIGVMAAALGFRAVVHMSADAKEWKKDRLRRLGVRVIEHTGDFAQAVAAGRQQARDEPRTYFVDDESSSALFLGYAVAALRLRQQLASANIAVDAEHPLFVYLPCGVGGAPGGITFGLRHVFGDHVHCFLAEPTAAPCMLLRLAAQPPVALSVYDIGLDNRTEADGLAVARASDLAALLIQHLVAGVFTVPDDDLFRDLYRLESTEGIRIEPSAAAGFRGPLWLETSSARAYLDRHALTERMPHAHHLLWTTGGAFVPEEEYARFHAAGCRLAHAEKVRSEQLR